MKIEDNRNDTRKFSDLVVGDVFIFKYISSEVPLALADGMNGE